MPRKDTDVQDYVVHGIYFALYGLVKYVPPPVGNVLRRWVTRLFCKELGRARIGEGVTIYYPYRLRIGDHVTLNEFVYLSAFGEVTIGDETRIGTGTATRTGGSPGTAGLAESTATRLV